MSVVKFVVLIVVKIVEIPICLLTLFVSTVLTIVTTILDQNDLNWSAGAPKARVSRLISRKFEGRKVDFPALCVVLIEMPSIKRAYFESPEELAYAESHHCRKQLRVGDRHVIKIYTKSVGLSTFFRELCM